MQDIKNEYDTVEKNILENKVEKSKLAKKQKEQLKRV